MDGFQCDDHLDRGAVRVRDDPAVFVIGDLLRVHLGHDERDVRLVAEGCRIVDDHATRLRCDGGKLLADAPPCGEEPDLDAAEGVLLEHLDGIGLALELEFLPQGALRGEQGQFADRKISFLQDADHFVSDGAGGADDGYTVFSHEIRLLIKRLALRYNAAFPPGPGLRAITGLPRVSFLFSTPRRLSAAAFFPGRRSAWRASESPRWDRRWRSSRQR